MQLFIDFNSCFFHLEVMAEPLNSIEHVVDVLFLDRLIGDNAPEEVGVLAKRLVADHNSALRHHAGLDLSCHLSIKSNSVKNLHRL
jgi:hypothetical protein